MDELELEVTDLRARADGTPEPTEEEALLAPMAERRPNRGDAYSAGNDLPLLWGRRSLPMRRRLLAGAAGGAALLVALSVIVAAWPGGPAIMGRLFPSPTPLPAGAGVFLVVGYAPWGTLRIGGRSMALDQPQRSPELPESDYVPSFALRPGHYALEYRAPPFRTLRCQVSVPFARSDTCPLAHPNADTAMWAPPAARILDLQAAPNRLAPDQRAALVAAIQEALGPAFGTVSVLPGEAYRAADGTVAVAREPLSATFSYTLNEDPARTWFGPYCITLCDNVQLSMLPPPAWLLYAHVVMGWRYATLDGRVLIPYAPAAQAGVASGNDRQVALEVYWDGGWRVDEAPQPSQVMNPTCSLLAAGLSALGDGDGPPLSTFSGDNPAEGCVAVTSVFDAQGNLEAAYFLYQFGVVVAVNAAAHNALPQLPLADARQQALAQRLYAQGNPA